MLQTTLFVADKTFATIPEHTLEAFFATVSYRLEPEGRATRFPVLMKQLYAGTVEPHEALTAARELETVGRELKALSPDRAVWNLQDLTPLDPTGQPLNAAAGSLDEFFITSEGRPLLSALREAVDDCRRLSQPLKLEAPRAPAAPRDALRNAALVLFVLACGVGVTWHNWHTLINSNYYYPKMAFLGPPLALFGLISIFRVPFTAAATAGGGMHQAGKRGNTTKVLWIIFGIIALLAGALNVYWMENYYN